MRLPQLQSPADDIGHTSCALAFPIAWYSHIAAAPGQPQSHIYLSFPALLPILPDKFSQLQGLPGIQGPPLPTSVPDQSGGRSLPF